MRLRWKIAIPTHIVAVIFEILLIAAGGYELLKNTQPVKQDDTTFTISFLSIFFIHSLAGVYTAYCMHRYCNGRYFSLLSKRIYTGLLIFSIFFVILILTLLVAGLIEFQSTPGYEKTIPFYIIGSLVFGILFLWNLFTQITFRRRLIHNHKEQMKSLIDSIGNPA